jgi:hypothetical protein
VSTLAHAQYVRTDPRRPGAAQPGSDLVENQQHVVGKHEYIHRVTMVTECTRCNTVGCRSDDKLCGVPSGGILRCGPAGTTRKGQQGAFNRLG